MTPSGFHSKEKFYNKKKLTPNFCDIKTAPNPNPNPNSSNLTLTLKTFNVTPLVMRNFCKICMVQEEIGQTRPYKSTAEKFLLHEHEFAGGATLTLTP